MLFGEVFLAAVVHATLQLSLGALLLLYHASLGKHIRPKTKQLVESYISGVGILTMLGLATMTLIFDRLFGGALFEGWLILVVAMLVGLAVVAWFCYYRRGRSTELWLPRTVAKFIDSRAKITNSNTEAFALGLLTGFAEMPFTLILMAVAANAMLQLGDGMQLLALAIYVIIVILPSVIMRLAIKKGKTVVEVQRWRVKHKMFFRILTGSGFLILGFFIFAFGVLG